MVETEISRVIENISQDSNVIGVIVTGSFISGIQDDQSDLDLLMITASGPVRQELRRIPPVLLDIYQATLSSLRQKLHSEDHLNNNFILNALISGHVHVDHDGSAAILKSEAQQLWNDGPRALTSGEYQRSRQALYRMVASAEKLTARSALSAEAALIATMRTDQLVVQAIYLHHRYRRLWTAGFPQLLSWIRNQHHDLYNLWTEYVWSNTASEKLMIARRIVEFTVL